MNTRKPETANGQPATPPEVPAPAIPGTPAVPAPAEPGAPDPSLPEAPPPMQPDDPTNPIETPAPDPTNDLPESDWPESDWDVPREQDTDRDGIPDRFEVQQSESIDEQGPSAAELS